jgi:hypothetical protein
MTDTYLGFASLLLMLVSGVLWFQAAGRVALPKNRSRYVFSWVVAALLGVLALGGEPGWLGGVPAALGTFFACFGLLTVSISRQKVAADAIAVGGSIPDFSVPDENGEIFDSSSLAGHPVLIKFFRGHW